MFIKREMMWLAEDAAKKSPCIRRKYGVVIDDGSTNSATCNSRVGKCCSGNICVRDRFQNYHGERVEQGGEIHAEQAALLTWKKPITEATHFYLTGFDKRGKRLLDRDSWPCHACAMMIKFAGFRSIVINNRQGDLTPISISTIIEEQESGWDEPF